MALGLIFESNPYHFGHRYLINKATSLYPNEEKILITSTSFTMRGEISLINKFDKIGIYLSEGIDIILELPITNTLQSADYFALSTVLTLSKFNITKLLVGCEITDLALFQSLYETINSSQFKALFNDKEKHNLSYKKRFSECLMELNIENDLIDLFNKPNMTLAFQYFKIIKDYKLDIELILIERTNDYYQDENSDGNLVVSSSFIRKALKNEQKISQFLPYNMPIIDVGEAEKNLTLIINFQMMRKNNIDPSSNDFFLNNYINKNHFLSKSYDELITYFSNKTFTKSRIRRFIIKELLGIKNINCDSFDYLRIIGLSEQGKAYINTLPKHIKKLIFSSPKKINSLSDINKEKLNFELNCTKLFGILTNNLDLYLNEYKLPLKKEG